MFHLFFLGGRLVVRVGHGQFRFHLGLPGDEFVLHFLGLVRILLGQIVLLGRILGQVVELDLLVVVELD